MGSHDGCMTQTPDFRSDLDAAHRWVAELMSGVRPEQLDDTTPCAELDVRALLHHFAAHPTKLTAIATGGAPRTIDDSGDIDEQRPAEDYLARATAALDAWGDDALLDKSLIAPWGEAPGWMSVGAFLMETVTHGWDLAVATGQDAEADPALVAKAQAIADQTLSDDYRGLGFPFGERVEPSTGAGPTERLANFLGRRRPSSERDPLSV